MTERRANERRNWKAEVFPYDIFFPDNSGECLYCLTENQAMLLRGLLEPIAWKTRWFSDTQDIDRDTIEAFTDDTIRRLMMSCCGGDFEIIFRWTEDGVLQQSDDDGETWTDAPEDDPRNSAPTYPPVPGDPSDEKKCIAVTGMVQLIKEQVGDQLTDDMTRYNLGQLIHDWITNLLQSSNPFDALINIAVNQIFALVIAALRPALTDDVYDLLVCALLDNIADDLSFDEGAWEAVRARILTDISGIAGVFLEHLVFLLGKVGLTNLARSQAALEGDCDCGGECDIDNWTINQGNILNTYSDGWDLQATFNGTNYSVSGQTPNVAPYDVCCHVSMTLLSGSWAPPFAQINCGLNNADVANITNPLGNPDLINWFFAGFGSVFTVRVTLTP